MSATNFKFRFHEQEFAPPNGAARRKRNKEPNDTAHFMAGMFGGEPDSYNEVPAFEEWDDAKLRQAGFIHKKTYSYRSPGPYSRPLYQVLRYEHGLVPGEKRFLQRMPTGDEVSDFAFFATAGYVKILYNWPEIEQRKDEIVFFCEGEKDADRLMSLGLLATTIAGQNWTDTCARALAGRDVWILEDNDKEGRANALESANWLKDVARSIRIIRLSGLPHKGDVSDWLDAGHSKEELIEIGEATPLWVRGDISSTSPHDFPDETTIPLWDWLYGRHLLRGTTSLTAATGGTGKSSAAIVEAIAMTIGRPLLRIEVRQPLRVLLINLEDDRPTMNKRIAAVMKHYQLTKEDVGGRLFVKAKGEIKVKLAKYGRFKVVEIDEELKQQLIDFVTTNQIDVLSIDPFIKTHGINENNNVDIETVVEAFDDIAEEGHCAVHLWHHTPKMRGEEATVESARGAKALTDTCRSARILETMTKEEAANLKIDNSGLYFRAFSGKLNFAPPSAESDWYKLQSVEINNGGSLFGDEVGVVTRWTHPGITEIPITPTVLELVKAKVRSGRWREDSRAAMWVGKGIAEALSLDIDRDSDAIKKLVKKLIKDGVLKEVPGQDRHYRDVSFIEVV